jgi:riboflavin kinase/FMN adenylyltransferase
VLGPDARFGKNRRGDAGLLAELGRARGFSVERVEPVVLGPGRVSSSQVRAAVSAGDMVEAAAMLGRSFSLSGEVVKGDQRGRILGFPTANIATSPRCLLPAFGVYRAALELAAPRAELLPAAVNIGVRPTFGGSRLLVEAHAVGFSGDLYGQHVRIHLIERLRGERRFGSVDELLAQVTADVAQVAKDGTQGLVGASQLNVFA